MSESSVQWKVGVGWHVITWSFPVYLSFCNDLSTLLIKGLIEIGLFTSQVSETSKRKFSGAWEITQIVLSLLDKITNAGRSNDKFCLDFHLHAFLSLISAFSGVQRSTKMRDLWQTIQENFTERATVGSFRRGGWRARVCSAVCVQVTAPRNAVTAVLMALWTDTFCGNESTTCPRSHHKDEELFGYIDRLLLNSRWVFKFMFWLFRTLEQSFF